jgi:hypothetical protein
MNYLVEGVLGANRRKRPPRRIGERPALLRPPIPGFRGHGASIEYTLIAGAALALRRVSR